MGQEDFMTEGGARELQRRLQEYWDDPSRKSNLAIKPKFEVVKDGSVWVVRSNLANAKPATPRELQRAEQATQHRREAAKSLKRRSR